jgi:hypothetical protein
MIRKILIYCGLFLLGTILLVGNLSGKRVTNSRFEKTPQFTDETLIVSSYEYEWLSTDQRIERAQAIVAGVVTTISPTSWNSDRGQPWEADFPAGEPRMDLVIPVPLQIHALQVEVMQSIVDQIGLGKTVAITVLGNSPLDGREYTAHDLQVGDRLILLLEQGDLAWQGGLKTVVRLIGEPNASYFKLGENELYINSLEATPLSLDEFTDRVEQVRSLGAFDQGAGE